MKTLYYNSYTSNKRQDIINQCTQQIAEGKEIYYILPSREAMYDVRNHFIKNLGGLFNTKVLGFNDLEKMLVKDSLDDYKTIGDVEAKLIFKQIMSNLSIDSYFYKVKEKPGFLDLLIQTIRKIKRAELTPNLFKEKTSHFKGLLKLKCEELFNFYSLYESYKEEKRILDVDDVSAKAIIKIKNTALLKNTGMIVIDGFINIDPVNISLLKCLIESNPQIQLVSNVPYKNSEDVFLKNEVLKDFSELGFGSVDASETIDGSEIMNLSRDVQLYNSPCIDHEVRQAAGFIKELIQNEKINPTTIALVAKDDPEYQLKIHEVFHEYGIPINLKQRSKVLSIPLVKDIMSIWRLGQKDEYNEAVEVLVNSKYLEINSIDEFINTYNIESHILKLLLEKTSEALGNFITLLDSLFLSEKVNTLYNMKDLNEELWIRDLKAIQEIRAFFVRLQTVFEEYPTIEQRLDDSIKNIFELIENIELRQSSKDFGGVRYFSPDMMRGQIFDTVVLLGLNEGILPSIDGGAKFFNLFEMKEMFGSGLNLGDTDWETERERLRFGACVSAAEKRLYLSYRTAGEDGSVMIKSPFLEDFLSSMLKDQRTVLIHDKVTMRDRVSFDKTAYSVCEATKATVTKLRSHGTIEGRMFNKVQINRLIYPFRASEMECSREYNPSFDSFDGKLQNPNLGQQDSGYGFSASQLNSYAKCPFTYFAQRVLDLKVEDEALQGLLDLGNFYHLVLKDYYQGIEDTCTPDVEKLEQVFTKHSSDYNLEGFPEVLQQFVLDGIFANLEAFIQNDVLNMQRYYKETGFKLKPVILEEGFQIELGSNVLSSGVNKSRVKGFTDRIDLEVDDAGNYTGRYIIIDYKKGSIKSVKECIECTDFQLPIYQAAFMNFFSKKYGIESPECIALLYYSIEKQEWNGIIRKDMKKALFEGRKGPRVLPEKDNMATILDWSMDSAVNVMDKIRKGDFSLPINCPANAMFGCEYSTLCRYDRNRMFRKSGEV